MHHIINNPPSQDATRDEWRTWALRVRDIAARAMDDIIPQRAKIKTLKKDLKKKNRACFYYKQRIKELEEDHVRNDSIIRKIATFLRK